jgi:hypothetical protein
MFVSRVGIEPTTRGLKVPCSATELPAQHTFEFTSKAQENQRGPPIPSFVFDSLFDSSPEG